VKYLFLLLKEKEKEEVFTGATLRAETKVR